MAEMKAYLRSLAARLTSPFRRRSLELEMAEEMREHLRALAEANIAAGMTQEEAQFTAARQFGGVGQIMERCREQRGLVWLEQWRKDVGFAARSLIRAPGFSVAVVGTLALGIGVATVVFDLTAWLLIFSQPYPRPEQLYAIGYKDRQSQFIPYHPGFYFYTYQEQTNVFSEYADVNPEIANLVIDGEPTADTVMNVSADCFHTLGIRPVLGRGFLPEEFRAGADQVVIITDLFWRQHFNAAPNVLGRRILVDQHPCEVVGVLATAQPFPENFAGGVYRPLVFKTDSVKIDSKSVFDTVVLVIGRLRSGITAPQARTALAAAKLPTFPQWAAAFFAEQQPALCKLSDVTDKGSYWVMLVASGLLFIIACLNGMNLMLIRLLRRGRELTIRLALGATRLRIARLLVFETVGLALAAWGLVMIMVLWFFPIIFPFITGHEETRYQSYWDWKTLGCAAGLSFTSSLVVAVIPMLRLSKKDLNSGLKMGGTAVGEIESRGTGFLRNALVILQAALAVVLLSGTGLMVRTFQKLHRVDLGFDPVGKVKVHVELPHGFELKPQAQLLYFERLQKRVGTLPGVKGVAFGNDALLTGFAGTARLQMADGTFMPTAGSYASDDYQRTAGLIVKKGRWLSGEQRRIEVVINESLAKARFGDRNPIGESIKIQVSGKQPYEVVGVIRDVRDGVRSSSGLRIYFPNWMYPPNCNTLMLRLDHDPGKEFAGLIRRTLYEFDPKLIVADVSSIDDVVDNSMAAERYAFRILRGLSGIALGLAVVGLFSVVAYTVDTRMKEFGVRLALGAKPENLHRLVLRRGLATSAVGIVAGIVCALGLTRFMQSLLFETTPFDPMVYAFVAAMLLAATVAACWLPARRAARVDISRLLNVE
jgi:predicted permease